MDCLFCKIARGDKENLVWENEVAAAFNDIHPKAKTHLLIVPKKHVANLDDLDDEDLAGKLLMAVREVAEKVGIRGGYQLKLHNGRSHGQEIDHLHFHILSDQV